MFSWPFNIKTGCALTDVSALRVVVLDKEPEVHIIQLGAIIFFEADCITLPFTEVAQGMPMAAEGIGVLYDVGFHNEGFNRL